MQRLQVELVNTLGENEPHGGKSFTVQMRY